MKRFKRVWALMMIFILLFPNVTGVAAETDEDKTTGIVNISSDWQGTVFGDVGGQDKITEENFSIIENENDTVTLRSSGNRGKIASGADGLAYYYKAIDPNENFEITATAKVEQFDANNQVAFGVMLRDEVHEFVHGEDYGKGDYVAVGALKQKMKAFTRLTGSLSEYEFEDGLNVPAAGESYDLSIKKSGNIFTVKIGDHEQVIEDFTGDINYLGLFTVRNTTVEFSNINIAIEGEVDLGDWDFSAFGSNTSEEDNPLPKVSADDSVTLSATGGKISSSVDGISFYHKTLPANANFELTTQATVEQFGANNQVSFGLMLRDQVGEHYTGSGHEANYIAVGALDQAIKGFYKQGSQTKLASFDSNIPTQGSVYDLKVKKSGDTYVLTINGEDYETLTLDNLFQDEIFAGIYVARDTTVTFSDTQIDIDKRVVESLNVDPTNMKTAFLQGEELDLSGLDVTAHFSDGNTETLSESDYVVTGFDSSEIGPNTVTINYNGVTATLELNIVPLTVTDLEIKYYPAKTNYYKGDTFDPQGLVIIAEYNDGFKTSELTDDQYEFFIDGQKVPASGYIMNTAGRIEVSVESVETREQSISFEISVSNDELKELNIHKKPEKLTYFLGDELNLDGLSVYATYSNDKSVRLMKEEYEVSGFDSSRPGQIDLTITHKGEQVTFTINVKERELQGIEVSGYPQTTYYTGENFNNEGLIVSKVYDNKDREELVVDAYELDLTDYKKDTPGTYDIHIIPKDKAIDSILLPVTVRKQVEVEWKQVVFGQSASKDNNMINLKEDGTVEIIALEGGGKITGDHDGITFYYTEIDAEEDNFSLSADILVKDYAKKPHDGQESFGITARDAIGPAYDSSVFASNIASIGGFSGGTGETNGTQLFARTGVLASDGEGSEGITKIMLDPNKPDESNTSENYRLTLAKTNSGFTGKLNDGQEEIIFEPEILNVQDDKIYVGFYTARLATIEVSNIDLAITNAATDAPRVTPAAEAITPKIDVLSLDKTSDLDYSLLLRSNVDGIVTVKQGQEIVVEDSVITAGEMHTIPTELADNSNTNFSIVFLPDDTQYLTDYQKIVQNFTVTMKTYGKEDIYVSPTGTSAGDGTKENPLDIDTAIEFVQSGQQVIVLEGHYIRNKKLEIKKYNDGTADAMKYLVADPDAETRPLIDFDKKSEGVVHSGNYWHVEGIDFARSAGNKKGYTIGGSYNTIENVRTFEHGDTGLQISRTDVTETDKNMWPSHNLIVDSISFDNADPSENNADGFAAKLTSGNGNIFRRSVSHNNIDDGWDLYTKVGTGAIGSVTIEESISFSNGTLTNGHNGKGGKNGFKLGGEGVHVPHIVRNNLAFDNGYIGFTSNSNPGIIAENNISVDNETNLGFTTYTDIKTDFTIDGFISLNNKEDASHDSYPKALASDINYLFDGKTTSNQSGDPVDETLITAIDHALENLFIYDADGRILSIKDDEWESLWDIYSEVIASEDDSEEPVDPVDPVEPEEPEEPEEPVDPEDPVEPVEPVEPVDPEDPVEPTDPTDPADPEVPEEKPETPGEGSETNEDDKVEDPEESTDDPKSPEINGDGNEGGDMLPVTATNLYTMLLIGLMLLSIGSIAFVLSKRRKV